MLKARLMPLALALSVCLSALPIVSAMAANQTAAPISSSAAVTGSAVVAEAERFLGYPYAYTGDSPSTGFSCIGFVWYVYHVLGENIPGTNPTAVNAYPQVPESNLEPGDLVFFQGTFAGLYPSHVAIYIGGGKIIHAANPSYGVTISSLVNDPRDGDYWQQHYLSAERPWRGGGSTGGNPTLPHVHHVLVVVVPSLNLRSGPSYAYSVLTVLPRGSEVRVEGWAPGWVRVSTSADTVGWVERQGVAKQFRYARRLPVRSRSYARPDRTVWANAKTIYVGSLRVHSAPEMGAPVILTLVQGNRVGVFARYAGWAKILTARGVSGWTIARYLGHAYLHRRSRFHYRRYRTFTGRTPIRYGVNVHALPGIDSTVLTVTNGRPVQVRRWASQWAEIRLSTGTVGWVSREFIGVHRRTAGFATRAHRVRHSVSRRATFSGGYRVEAGVRIHTGPSLNYSVVASTTGGTRVRILGYSAGFAHVETSSGFVGWIASEFVGRSGATRHIGARSRIRRAVSGTHTSATVRLHDAAGVNAGVVGMVYAGTHVTVLGSTSGWYYVRLPSGRAGYIDAAYIIG